MRPLLGCTIYCWPFVPICVCVGLSNPRVEGAPDLACTVQVQARMCLYTADGAAHVMVLACLPAACTCDEACVSLTVYGGLSCVSALCCVALPASAQL